MKALHYVIYGLVGLLIIGGLGYFFYSYMKGPGVAEVARELDRFGEKGDKCDRTYPQARLTEKTGQSFTTIANGLPSLTLQCLYQSSDTGTKVPSITLKMDVDKDKAIMAKNKDYYKPDFSKYETISQFGSESELASQPVINGSGNTTLYMLMVHKDTKTYSVEMAEHKSPDETKALLLDIMQVILEKKIT
jgi:hypothetical protein